MPGWNKSSLQWLRSPVSQLLSPGQFRQSSSTVCFGKSRNSLELVTRPVRSAKPPVHLLKCPVGYTIFSKFESRFHIISFHYSSVSVNIPKDVENPWKPTCRSVSNQFPAPWFPQRSSVRHAGHRLSHFHQGLGRGAQDRLLGYPKRGEVFYQGERPGPLYNYSYVIVI